MKNWARARSTTLHLILRVALTLLVHHIWYFFTFALFVIAFKSSGLQLAKVESFLEGLGQRGGCTPITIIVPTSGRRSLSYSLLSLQQQTCSNWKAIVIFNGPFRRHALKEPQYLALDPSIQNDSRIKWHVYRSSFNGNCSGTLRNLGIAMAKTDWIGFLDDDDVFRPETIEMLSIEIRDSNADIIIYRMYNHRLGSILPPPNSGDFKMDEVGISFITKLRNEFRPSTMEDFDYLHTACHLGNFRCFMSNYILYFVEGRTMHGIPLILGTRAGIPQGSPPTRSLHLQYVEYYSRFCRMRRDITSPTINYLDEGSVFFAGNVLSLKTRLSRALGAGCGRGVLYQSQINLAINIFHLNEEQMKVPTIVLFLEQSQRIGETKHKLELARQVWTFSPSLFQAVRSMVAHDRIYLVPTFEIGFETLSLLNVEIPQFETYMEGCYYSYTYTNGTFNYLSSRSSKQKRSEHQCQPTHLTTPIDILFFGQIEGSFENRRENVCDQIHRLGHKTICAQGAFGRTLHHLLLNTKVVYIDRYYPGASLESHRLDLLWSYRILIVVVRSSDPFLNDYYQKRAIICEKEDLIRVVRKSLREWENLIEKYDNRGQNEDEISGICSALMNWKYDL